MIKERPLTKKELKLIKITELFHQQRFSKTYSWKWFILTLVVIFTCVIIALYKNEVEEYAWAVFISVIFIWYRWVSFKEFNKRKTESKKTLDYIKHITAKSTIRVTEYFSKRAILFEEYEDEGICHALEVGKNQLYFFWDIHEFGTSQYLPNTHFEVYEDKELPYVLGQDINMLGLPFQPIKIKRSIKWELSEILPTENIVKNISLDAFLDEIEGHFQNSVEKTKK